MKSADQLLCQDEFWQNLSWYNSYWCLDLVLKSYNLKLFRELEVGLFFPCKSDAVFMRRIDISIPATFSNIFVIFQLILLDNGIFSKRVAEICKSSGICVKVVPVNLKSLQEALIACPQEVSAVMAVHCETSTGIVNPIDEIGDVVKKTCPGI